MPVREAEHPLTYRKPRGAVAERSDHTRCEQAGDDRSYAEDLSKAEASKRIDALRSPPRLSLQSKKELSSLPVLSSQ
ncbi:MULTISPECIES: DUF3072 domain-containing protein [unclassified Mesorhizobium]|uniref:DUF3072 domain-containing protein n=1 Tax=unclassified Mesorhizobium TaxID=325217 RepID=UPI0012EC424A|nr:DUF3072 domain-containing protein [Mesorhizobium sp. LSJC269B00]